jgi:uncharacterized protein (TIGR03663 family)
MIPLRGRGILFLLPILLASALRFPSLSQRPMHADEGVHADKLGTLLEGGGYAYDPTEYHGPTLYYLTLVPAWLQGARRYVDVDETTLRSVPAAAGVALVAAHLGARAFLGLPGALVAASLAAVSPAMVYYSRDYIHETLLVLFTFCALLAAGRYRQRPGPLPAVTCGACVGLMLATKETALLALGSMLVALALTVLVERPEGGALAALRRALRGRDVLFALGAASGVAALLFSSFGHHPRGVLDAVRAYGQYAVRASDASWHFHPWDYYLRLLFHFPAAGTPVWTEAFILALAAAGAVAAARGRGVRGADPRILRFLLFYTLLMVVLYSAIPYKTPWCLLGFLHGMILLAGAGAVFVVQAVRGRARTGLGLLLAAAAAHLGWQAYAGSFRFAADPRNPYVYAQTGTDVFTIVGRLEALARVDPRDRALPIQVVSRANLWPLPFYLRRFTHVSWWSGVSDEAEAAPVILLTPDMEEALVHRLYDVPPPGERELYVSVFDRRVDLRPQVEIRGYARKTLWDEFRRSGADDAGGP